MNDTLHAQIDTQAAAYQAEIRAMAKAAQESINRSVGQHVRWHQEGIERFIRKHESKAAPISLSAIVFDTWLYSQLIK